jgi:hypothetical protein
MLLDPNTEEKEAISNILNKSSPSKSGSYENGSKSIESMTKIKKTNNNRETTSNDILSFLNQNINNIFDYQDEIVFIS